MSWRDTQLAKYSDIELVGSWLMKLKYTRRHELVGDGNRL
jgi:hypothetical protein